MKQDPSTMPLQVEQGHRSDLPLQPDVDTASPPADGPLWTHPEIFFAIWQHAADAMALSDADGIVLAANPAYCRLYGYLPEEVIGHDFSIIFPEEQRAWAAEQYRLSFAAQTKLPAYEATVRRRDGTERIVESRIDFLSTNGQRVAMLSTIHDITERKRAEEERVQLLIAEQKARMEAEAALQVRDQFLSIASHELRTPLTPLLGYAHMLRQMVGAGQANDAASVRLIDAMSRQIQRLNTLIGRLLDVSRLQQGRFVFERQPVDVVALVTGVVDEYRLAVSPQNGTDPFVLTSKTPELVVSGDRARLEEVVLNILSNAVKYSPAGAPIKVSVEQHGTDAIFEVSDEGIGIPADAQPHLFESFYRASNVGETISGFGIGLYIADQIVRGHNGQISVTSIEGHGSTFRVSLPLLHSPV
jgi:PAS domain S-box-containing protein